MKKCISLLLTLLLLIVAMNLICFGQNESETSIQVKDGICTIAAKDHNGAEKVSISLPQAEAEIHTLVIEDGIADVFIYAPLGKKTIEVKNVYIPASLSGISYNCCENYFVDEDNPYFSAIDGVLFSKDKKTLKIYGRLKNDISYTIPDGTETIDPKANFPSCIEKIVFPDSIKEINNPFNGCVNLEKVVFSKNIENIDVKGLKDTPWYKSGNMRMIGDGVLIGPCNDMVLSTPEECVTIAQNAFCNQTFEKVVIGDSVKRIARSAFEGSNIGELVIGSELEIIESNAFGGINPDKKWIEKVCLPDSLKEMYNAFFFAKVREIHLPDAYSGKAPSVFKLSKIFLNNKSETAAALSEKGILAFDSKTGNPILPTGENADYQLKHVKDMDLPDTKVLSSEVGENIVFKDKKPFVFMYDLYVPLRYMCEQYGIDICWNNDLGIAEVGKRGEIEPARENTAVFGNENLVVYNGKRLSSRHCVLLQVYYREDYVKGSEHSSINIDGTIYVPISDFVEGTGIGELYNYNMSPINALIIEAEMSK